MKRLSNLRMAIVIAVILLVFASCQGPPPVAQTLDDAGYWVITSANITLRWRVNGQNLDVILSAPTSGWVAVGFDPTSMMRDANFVLTEVNDGVAVARDDYGTGLTSHASDVSLGGTDNVTNLTGTETGGTTEVSFTIPLDSGDEFDRPLEPGAAYRVLLAYSVSSDLSVKHTQRTAVEITL